MPLSAIHPAFLRWLDANHARFALGVEIGPRSDGALEFAFAGITHAIGGVLTDSEIEVAATYEGVRWDILVDFEAQPRRVRGGAVSPSARRRRALCSRIGNCCGPTICSSRCWSG